MSTCTTRVPSAVYTGCEQTRAHPCIYAHMLLNWLAGMLTLQSPVHCMHAHIHTNNRQWPISVQRQNTCSGWDTTHRLACHHRKAVSCSIGPSNGSQPGSCRENRVSFSAPSWRWGSELLEGGDGFICWGGSERVGRPQPKVEMPLVKRPG